jgi:hypothetical protein
MIRGFTDWNNGNCVVIIGVERQDKRRGPPDTRTTSARFPASASSSCSASVDHSCLRRTRYAFTYIHGTVSIPIANVALPDYTRPNVARQRREKWTHSTESSKPLLHISGFHLSEASFSPFLRRTIRFSRLGKRGHRN